MAFQNVSIPRIYLNIPEYLASTGLNIDPVFRTLPVGSNAVGQILAPDISGVTLTNPYIAILGHTETDGISIGGANVQGGGIINGDFDSGVKNGFSIAKLDTAPTSITTENIVGSILVGTYFDFPNSPDLNLSFSYDYSGNKEITTKGGSTITNSFYNSPSAWGGLGAWELGGNPEYAKSGRRVWNLSFSYLSDSSVFPDNAALVNEDSTSTDSTLFVGDTIQRVIHFCNGGQIPFIFQSDNTVDATSPKQDQLAIAKFDQSSFKLDKVANCVYNVKLKIREVW